MILFLKDLPDNVVYRIQIVEELITNSGSTVEFILHLMTKEKTHVRVWGEPKMMEDIQHKLEKECAVYLAMSGEDCFTIALETALDIKTKKKTTYPEFR